MDTHHDHECELESHGIISFSLDNAVALVKSTNYLHVDWTLFQKVGLYKGYRKNAYIKNKTCKSMSKRVLLIIILFKTGIFKISNNFHFFG